MPTLDSSDTHRLAAAATPRPELPPALLRPTEAANYLAISRAALFELIRTNRIASLKIGKSRRIRRETLDSFAAALEGEHSPGVA